MNDNSEGDGAGILGSAFKLSRVFAEGWNTARKLPVTARDGLTQQAIAELNPYANEPERTRWIEGFTKALDG